MPKNYPGPGDDALAEFLRANERQLRGNDGPTEFSYGPGLVPPGKKHAPPNEGGMYRGRSPRSNRPTDRDRDAPGHPGVRVR